MNNKKIIIALAILAALTLVLSGCGDMFEKIKNPDVSKVVAQSAYQANDATPDGASIYELIMRKIPIGGTAENPTTGTVTNPNGGSATFSGYLASEAVEIDFVYTDWATTNAEGDYTVSGDMHCSITSQWFNDPDEPDYTDQHDANGDGVVNTTDGSDAHLHMYFHETGAAISLMTGSDTRKTDYDLTSDYYAAVEDSTIIITHETFGKVGGNDIEPFLDSFNASL